jgi:hypothetical protein
MQAFAASFTSGASPTGSATDTLSSFISKYQMRLLVRSAKTRICCAFWAFRSSARVGQRVVASDTIERHAISAMLEGIGYYQRRGHAVGRKIVEEI